MASCPESSEVVLESESLRVQLAELNARSRAYTAQVWQIPFAYLGIVGVVLAQVADKPAIVVMIALFSAAAFGLFVLIHLIAMTHGIRRAVENIVKVEGQLGLPATAQYRFWSYIMPLAMVVTSISSACLIAGACFCFRPTP
jgi:hypothetical protein